MQEGSWVCDFGIFDQAQVQDRESSHYGLWQISIGSNHKPLYNTAKQRPCQYKHTLGLWKIVQYQAPYNRN